MGLSEDLARIAEAAQAFAAPDETLAAVIPTEPATSLRLYLCGYARGDDRRWLVLDEAGAPVRDRTLVREAVGIAAMCEIAEESAGGGDVAGLRERLRELRETEAPEGIEQAEEAALALEQTLQPEPRIASPDYLDRVGGAARRLEQTLAPGERSPFADAMRSSVASIEELKHDVETSYKADLDRLDT